MVIAVCAETVDARLGIPEDRDVKEWDLTGWTCLDQPGGSAKTPWRRTNRGDNPNAG
ncbi:hypothetical protein BH18VER1_BH18VER1_08890 [soil metagenome]